MRKDYLGCAPSTAHFPVLDVLTRLLLLVSRGVRLYIRYNVEGKGNMMLAELHTYAHRTAPYAHQAEALRVGYRKRAFAYFMDPGTGKTKVVLDTTALLFYAGHIRGLLIAAPNDVHAQWIEEQIPLHLPEDIAVRAVVWDASRMSVLRKVEELLKPLPRRLHVLAMNCEAFATQKGLNVARRFLTVYPSLFVLDESHNFANPTALRTKGVMRLRELAFARRVLSGTPMDGDPFDLFAQFAFLDPRITGYDSFLAFKHRYGVFTKETVTIKGQYDDEGRPRRRQYESLQEYQRLEELFARVGRFVYRKSKAECRDMPPVNRARLFTHLSPAQQRVYRAIEEEGLVLLRRAEAGLLVDIVSLTDTDEDELIERLGTSTDRMTMSIKLVLLLRLQQCAAGFVTDDAKQTTLIDGHWTDCPRMAATVERVEQALATDSGKVIVWAHFRAALHVLAHALVERLGKDQVVLIDGLVTGAARAERIARFKQDAQPRVLVAHPRTMGVGQNLGMATTALFYTNSYSWTQRRQTEDRIDRIDRQVPCTLVDLVARDAGIDQLLLTAHDKKGDFVNAFARLSSEQLKELLQC